MCMVAVQLLKFGHQKMCLVQRAVSVLMYGNGSTKAVNYLEKKGQMLFTFVPACRCIAACRDLTSSILPRIAGCCQQDM